MRYTPKIKKRIILIFRNDLEIEKVLKLSRIIGNLGVVL